MAREEQTLRVAIVGAGISGLSAALRLQEKGISVTLFDKGRRPGGRLASRQKHSRQFDHGAQYLKPHSGRSAVLFSKWRRAGLIQNWRAVALELPQRKRIDTSSWHVALPCQNSLAKHLSKGLDIRCGWTVCDISGERGRWNLIAHNNRSEGPFGAVLVTCPPEQSAVLLRPFEDIHSQITHLKSRPCLATLVEFEEELPVDFEAAFIKDSPLAWICRDSAKPGRPEGESWVLHATEEWSLEHLELTPEKFASKMLEAFAPFCPVTLPSVLFCRGHRWRYALPSRETRNSPIFNPELGLGVCGDWCGSPNVDGAFWSGYDLAEAFVDQFM